jgi:hypothetical protein
MRMQDEPLAPERIHLLRLFGRAPYIDVAHGELHVRLPGIFGGGTTWRLPIEQVVLVTTRPRKPADPSWAFVCRQEVAYLPSDLRVRPNLTLLFRVPQRIPPVRPIYALTDGNVPYFKSHSDGGVWLDGASFRASEPERAHQMLASAGIECVGLPARDWLLQRRDVTRDSGVIVRIVSKERRLRRLALTVFVVGFALLFCAPLFIRSDLTLYLLRVLGITWLARAGWDVRTKRARHLNLQL